MKRLTPMQTVFGCWALVHYAVCVLNRLGFTPPFFDSMNENALFIGMLLVICGPIGYAVFVMGKIGLSVDEAPREVKRAVQRRMRETWVAFPFSSTAVIVGFVYPWIDAFTVQVPDHPQMLLLISMFDLFPIFLCFRFLPSEEGKRLIRKWMRETDR